MVKSSQKSGKDDFKSSQQIRQKSAPPHPTPTSSWASDFWDALGGGDPTMDLFDGGFTLPF